ncbi:glutamine-hydrolyzing carbamoyl-phosphate synthase small subunit [soil metagenome]
MDTLPFPPLMKLVLGGPQERAVFEGTSFGADADAAGEVVFNTGMTGYVEALTDPSYRGQILVLTYPLQGNYGVPKEPWESGGVQVAGLVVGRLAIRPTHPGMRDTLSDWLSAAGVPALEGVDTRAITRRLRAEGTMSGLLLRDERIAERPTALDMRHVAQQVAEPGIHRHGNGERRVLVIDCGTKRSIIQSLVDRGLSVVHAAFFEAWEPLLDEVDAVVLPNGPGDPAVLGALVERLRPLLDGKKPVLGICLGHQLLALAAGATTYKLPYGHRSQNQPVVDLTTRRTYLTSQNHGYAVRTESIPKGFVPWFQNLNDGTNEGLAHETLPLMSVQFHPEAASGPHDTQHVFDRFAQAVLARPRS